MPMKAKSEYYLFFFFGFFLVHLALMLFMQGELGKELCLYCA